MRDAGHTHGNPGLSEGPPAQGLLDKVLHHLLRHGIVGNDPLPQRPETEEALKETTSQVVETIHSVLEKTPPELAADIADFLPMRCTSRSPTEASLIFTVRTASKDWLVAPSFLYPTVDALA